MKYAHLADLHLGSWREEKMRDLSTQSFLKAMNNCLQDQVDFILFAGDIFNTSLPSIDTLKLVTEKLRELKEKNIPIYVIAGSHDFSPSGKTMIEVLEKAGLVRNVCRGQVNPQTKELELKFTLDAKTGAKITGLIGRKGLLDKTYYESLRRDYLEQEFGYKIFMFHTTVTELVPEHLTMIDSQPASLFPKSFNYYAGGHIHHPTKINVPGVGVMTYPGALFPNNFAELEQYGQGGYYLITVNNHLTVNDPGAAKNINNYLGINQTNLDHNQPSQQNGDDLRQDIHWIPIKIIPRLAIKLECNHKTPAEIEKELLQKCLALPIKNSLITIKLSGRLHSGKLTDIPWNDLLKQFYQQGAYWVMKNTSQLISEEFKEIKVANSSPEAIEDTLMTEQAQQLKLFDLATEIHLTKTLLSSLNTARKEGESVTDFQQRIEAELKKILEL